MREESHLPDLQFNFHDALLMNFQLGPRRELLLHIALYPIFYPDNPPTQVRFGAITNYESVCKYFKKIKVPDEVGEPIQRIDALHYDHRKQSTAGKLFFYLELDRQESLEIHCAKLDVSAL